jgi:hypothetical protein
VPVSVIKQVVPGDPLKIPLEVSASSASVYSGTITCELDKEVKINEFLPTNFRGQVSVAFTGRNLNPSGRLQVNINGLSCTLSYSNGVLIANLPVLPLQVNNIPVEVYAGGKLLFKGFGSTMLLLKFDQIKAQNIQLEKVKAMTRK